MSIGSIGGAGALQAAETAQQIDVAVFGKVQEAAKQEAEAALALLDSVADAGGQSQSDGHQLDVTA